MTDEIIIYSKPDCKNCEFAKTHFRINDIPYTELNVKEYNDEGQPENLRAMKKALGTDGKVDLPVIMKGNELLVKGHDSISLGKIKG